MFIVLTDDMLYVHRIDMFIALTDDMLYVHRISTAENLFTQIIVIYTGTTKFVQIVSGLEL